MLPLQPPSHLYIPMALLRWGLATTCNCLVDQQLTGTAVAAWPTYGWWLLLLMLLTPAAVMLLEAQAASSAAALWATDLVSDAAEPGADDMAEGAGSKAAGAAVEQEPQLQEEASAGPGITGPGATGPGTAEHGRLCAGGDGSSDAPDDVPAALACLTAVSMRAAVTPAALASAEAPAALPAGITHSAAAASASQRISGQMPGGSSSSSCPAGALQPASPAWVDAGTAAAWDSLPAFDEDNDSWLCPPLREACAGTISVKVSSGMRRVLS